jgi:cell division protein FtsI (penicillin-binding protein 3)
MDAVSLLENIGLNVKIVGNGTVNKQSLKSGSKIRFGKKITLYLS